MSVAGISSSGLFNYAAQGVNNNVQQFRQEFQQLGQDLQSGNLSAAQTDFATLQQSGFSAQSNSPIAQDFKQLSQDLQSGSVPAAQQDFAKIQQDLQNQSVRGHGHHHGGGGGGGSSAINQLLEQLGQELHSGKSVVGAGVLHRVAAGLPANHREQRSVPAVVGTHVEHPLGKRLSPACGGAADMGIGSDGRSTARLSTDDTSVAKIPNRAPGTDSGPGLCLVS
jgi:hypothetical protein